MIEEREITEAAETKDSNVKSGRLSHVLLTFFPKLIGASLLFTLCSLPIVTIPAAYCGLHSVVQHYYNVGCGSTVISEFFREFKCDFLRRTAIMLVIALLPVAAVLLFNDLSTVITYVLGAGLLSFGLMLCGWFVPQIVFTKLLPGEALRNSFLLIMIEPVKSFLLLLIQAASAALILLLRPLSPLVLLPFLPGLSVLLMTALVIPVLHERIIGKNSTKQY